MSAIDPEKQAIIQELWNRRESLDPEKRAVVDELAARTGISNPQPQPQPQAAQAAPPISISPTQTNEYQMLAGAAPPELLDRLKGLGRSGAQKVMTGVQYLQNLTGSKVSPTPTMLEPSQNPNQAIGEKIGDMMLPMIAGGIGPMPVQTALGALAGGMAEQQQGGTGTTGAVIGGALPFVGKTAAEAVKSAAPAINRWLQVAPKELERGADPGARLINEGLVRATKRATEQAIQPALNEAGAQLNGKLVIATAKGIKIDGSQIVQDALTTATKTIGKRSDKAFQTALTQVFDDIISDFPDVDKLTPLRAQELKVAVGDAIKWHGAAYEGDVNEALVDIYRGVNKAIKSSVPGVDALQSRWGDLYIASKTIAKSIVNDRAGQGTGALNPIIKTGAKIAAAGTAGAYGFRRMTQ